MNHPRLARDQITTEFGFHWLPIRRGNDNNGAQRFLTDSPGNACRQEGRAQEEDEEEIIINTNLAYEHCKQIVEFIVRQTRPCCCSCSVAPAPVVVKSIKEASWRAGSRRCVDIVIEVGVKDPEHSVPTA